MRAIQKPSIWLGALLVSSVSACELTKVDCDETPEAAICQPWPEEDAGDELDAGSDAGKSDAGSSSDGGGDSATGDAGAGSDAGKDGGGGSDAGSDGSANPTLTIDEFCTAQYETAVAWRDDLESLCGSASLVDRENFLLEVFAYPKDDAEGKCISARQAAVNSGNSTFDGTKAQACADAFLANFETPPDPFPTDGIDLAMYEAKIAHGAPTIFQIPACRAAFKGKLTLGKPCADHFECVEGLRCLDAPGGGKACATALVGGTCLQSSQCADGYTCVGATTGPGRTCVDSTMLALNTSSCLFSLECVEGLICNASGKCANPTPQVICKP